MYRTFFDTVEKPQHRLFILECFYWIDSGRLHQKNIDRGKDKIEKLQIAQKSVWR